MVFWEDLGRGWGRGRGSLWIVVVSLEFWLGLLGGGLGCWIRNWIFMLGRRGRGGRVWCLEFLGMENCWGIECFEELWLRDFFEVRRSEGVLSALGGWGWGWGEGGFTLGLNWSTIWKFTVGAREKVSGAGSVV
jgi:hypothetical protein